MVRIMHPGCSKPLFALPAFPRPAAPDTNLRPLYNVDQRLILDACRVITNDVTTDAYIGYLSNDRAGHDRIPFSSADSDADSGVLPQESTSTTPPTFGYDLDNPELPHRRVAVPREDSRTLGPTEAQPGGDGRALAQIRGVQVERYGVCRGGRQRGVHPHQGLQRCVSRLSVHSIDHAAPIGLCSSQTMFMLADGNPCL